MTPDDVRRDHREIYVQPKVLPFDGTDAEFLDHLIDDDGSVARDHDAYVLPRVNPVRNSRGRDQMLLVLAQWQLPFVSDQRFVCRQKGFWSRRLPFGVWFVEVRVWRQRQGIACQNPRRSNSRPTYPAVHGLICQHLPAW